MMNSLWYRGRVSGLIIIMFTDSMVANSNLNSINIRSKNFHVPHLWHKYYLYATKEEIIECVTVTEVNCMMLLTMDVKKNGFNERLDILKGLRNAE